jgi:hypothetical protein
MTSSFSEKDARRNRRVRDAAPQKSKAVVKHSAVRRVAARWLPGL